MPELRADVVVDAPADVTWAAVTDWDRQATWVPATTVRVTSGDGRSEGSALAAVTGLGRLRFTDPMVITAWQPPYRCDVLHTGRVVRGTGMFEVVSLPEGRSRFIWSEQLELPGPVRVALRVTRPALEAALGLALRRLAGTLVHRPEDR